ncbi:hypothetical protein [Akkermansia sp.]|uniref:hypothetical protein n=1 Tax=Akkermansia sp. TaxID=1872421 RepID=UPI003991C79A
MKFTIPFSLRRSLFAGFFMSLSASAADYTVDASQTSDPGRKVYQTLAELASAGVLAAGDTVILNNDDSSLTSKLPVFVNFRSNDPETPRTVDLSGLGNTPLFSPAKGNYTLNMESVVFSNAPARVFFYNNSSSSAPISLKISDNVSFTKNYSSDRNSFTANGYGGAICLYSSAATALSMGNNAMFADNRAAGNGGAISVHSYGKTASLTIGNNAVFSGNYASGNGGGAVQVYGATGSAAVIGDNATFTGNYLLGGYGGSGGAIYVVMPDSTNYGKQPCHRLQCRVFQELCFRPLQQRRSDCAFIIIPFGDFLARSWPRRCIHRELRFFFRQSVLRKHRLRGSDIHNFIKIFEHYGAGRSDLHRQLRVDQRRGHSYARQLRRQFQPVPGSDP